MATEAGKRLAGQAMTQIEQVTPDLKEQVGQWRRGSSKNKADAEKAATRSMQQPIEERRKWLSRMSCSS